ncbi:hypothetical protein [Aurantimonas sp. 22II-16-19i]|uniref:hypothetical protein n=1 Tax=Aurantimonas sp. 22II-16-19i TaxID=1317114 RepID=UPI0009F7AB55|nr:hypothetical protein [Aurantimonas sp. 22II-16-19i]ORE94942.1 hypothetical protein ATO4_13710 [Aurantimonas sp. 22II-16-19i]
MTDLRTERPAGPAVALRRISWGGILAGAILALMIQFMLGLLGLAIGLTSAGGSSGGLFSLAGLWAIVVVLVGVFVGAYAAARFAGIPSRIDGMLHGVVTWAVTGLFALYLLSSGAAGLVGGAFGVLGQSIDDLTSAAEALAPGSSTATALLRENAGTLFAPPSDRPADTDGEAAADPDAAAPPVGVASAAAGQASFGELSAALAEDAGEGERSAAIDAIVRTAGVGRAEAERRFQALEQRAGEARAEAEAGRRAAASSLARAALAAFVAMLLGMVVGGLGGMLGRPGRVASERPSRH